MLLGGEQAAESSVVVAWRIAKVDALLAKKTPAQTRPHLLSTAGAECPNPPPDLPMADDDSLAALEGLHRDLCAYIDLGLPVLDRLLANLGAHWEELKTLLDKKPKNNASRKTLASGMPLISCASGAVSDNILILHNIRQDHSQRQRI